MRCDSSERSFLALPTAVPPTWSGPSGKMKVVRPSSRSRLTPCLVLPETTEHQDKTKASPVVVPFLKLLTCRGLGLPGCLAMWSGQVDRPTTPLQLPCVAWHCLGLTARAPARGRRVEMAELDVGGHFP